MAETSSIEWTDATFNPWIGCTKVSPGCDHCYAERDFATRRKVVQWGSGAARKRTSTANWRQPLRWQRDAAAFEAEHGRRRRVFCASLADVFDNEVPVEWRVDLFRLIGATPDLDWLVLTKRIGNVLPMMRDVAKHCGGGEQPMPNVWLGISVVNQVEADRDIPKLLTTPAAVRFLSIEPMLRPIEVPRVFLEPLRFDGRSFAYPDNAGLIDWIIAGGESGPHARPMHPDWARGLRDQCAAAGVPFLFKQWGEWGPDWEGAETCGSCGNTKFDTINSYGECGRCGVDDWMPASTPLDKPRRVGKKAAGRLLDGVEHNGFPVGVRQAS